MKIFKNKLLTACLSLLLMIPNIGAEDTIAKSGELLQAKGNGQQSKTNLVDKDKNSQKAENTSDVVLVPVSLDTLATGIIITGLVAGGLVAYIGDKIVDKVTYELKKSVNGVDTRGIGKRGAKAKKGSIDIFSSSEQKYAYLQNKWSRNAANNIGYPFKLPDLTALPIIFARSLPTVPLNFTQNCLIGDYEFYGADLMHYSGYFPYSDCLENNKRTFYTSGCLNITPIPCMEACGIIKESEPAVSGNLQYTFMKLIPLFICEKPDDKYFIMYYFNNVYDGRTFYGPYGMQPYERFDYNRWADDTFGKDFTEVLNKHTEIFCYHGARWDEEQACWDLANFNILGAEEAAKSYLAHCKHDVKY